MRHILLQSVELLVFIEPDSSLRVWRVGDVPNLSLEGFYLLILTRCQTHLDNVRGETSLSIVGLAPVSGITILVARLLLMVRTLLIAGEIRAAILPKVTWSLVVMMVLVIL